MAVWVFKCVVLVCCFAAAFSIQMPPVVKKVSPASVLGEGPHWDAKSQSLYYVDIYGQKIMRLEPSSGALTSAHLNRGTIGAVVPVKGKSDQLIAAVGTEVLLVTWDGKQNVTDPPLQKLASLDQNQTDTRTNDGKCDRRGRFWIGTMANEHDGHIASDKGTLYRLDNDLKLHKILSPVSISNGLAWNAANNAFYYIDSPTKVVYGFDYDVNTGDIKNKKVVFNLVDHKIGGVPDGMTIDTNDNLWIAVHNAGLVINVNPKTGELIQQIEVPAKKLTSTMFGGPNLDILYVTSAHTGLTDSEKQAQPDSGSVFAITGLGVKGVPANDFVLSK